MPTPDIQGTLTLEWDPMYDRSTQRDVASHDVVADDALPVLGWCTPYTAPCAVCGRRLHLSEDDLVASLSVAPVCWLCDG